MIALLHAKFNMDAHLASCAVCAPVVAAWRATIGTDAETGAQPELCDVGVAYRKEHTRALMALPFDKMQAYVATMIALDGL